MGYRALWLAGIFGALAICHDAKADDADKRFTACAAQKTLLGAIQGLVADSPLSAVQKWQDYRTRGASSCDYAGCRLVLTYPSISPG
jgi:hypothetical protein